MSILLKAPVLIVVFAVAMGTAIDALVKAVAPEVGLHHLLAWRFLFGALIALSVFRAQCRPRPSWEAIRFHTLRGLVQLAGAALFFYALTELPLALATIIGFSAALMVPFVARLLLREAIHPATLIASLLGFVGVGLAVLGGATESLQAATSLNGVVACILAALLYAFILVMLRMRATHEDATTIAMFTNLVPALAMLPVTLGLFGAVDLSDLPLFAVLGLLGFLVWYLMTLGYARAPAQQLAPLEYTALIWSGLLGAMFFAEYPGWQTWLGAAIIIACCLYIAFETHFKTRRAAQMPASDLPE